MCKLDKHCLIHVQNNDTNNDCQIGRHTYKWQCSIFKLNTIRNNCDTNREHPSDQQCRLNHISDTGNNTCTNNPATNANP